MNGSVFADSVVSSGSSRSGSVSMILRSTACSATDRCAYARPRSEQLGQVGRVAHVVGEPVEVVGELPADGLEQQLVAAAGELAVDRGPGDARLLHDVVDRRLAQPEALHAAIGRGEQPVVQAERIARLGHARPVGVAAWVPSAPLCVRIDARDGARRLGRNATPQVVWHGFTQMSTFAENRPIIVDRAEGHELIDVDGRRYLDAISSLWVTTLGHHVPELDDAIRSQLELGAHSTMLGNGNRVVDRAVGGAGRASCPSTTRTSSTRPTARPRSSRR